MRALSKLSVAVYLAFACLCACGFRSVGADWPQFLGPTRNGVYSGKDISDAWPKEGPPVTWKKTVGQGFSGPVCHDGKLILFHRLDDEEVVDCYRADTGDRLWRFQYAASYRDDFGFDEGPRATPSIVDGSVYTFGAEGVLHRIDLQTGRKIWRVDTKEMLQARKGFFGMACSPLVEGGRVMLNVGGAEGAGIVAFDIENGRVAWKATDHEAGYSSPVAFTIGELRVALFFTREGLVGIEPSAGKVVWQFPWRSRMHASVNAATPLLIGDLIFLSASYDTGAILLQAKGRKLEKIWASDDALSNHYASSVHHDGFLYGFHGRQETGPSFRCVELRSGKVRWNEDRLPAGTVTLAGGKLLILLEDGRLIMAAASPESWNNLAEAQVLPFGVRAYPALADGALYARSRDTLVRVDLRRR